MRSTQLTNRAYTRSTSLRTITADGPGVHADNVLEEYTANNPGIHVVDTADEPGLHAVDVPDGTPSLSDMHPAQSRVSRRGTSTTRQRCNGKENDDSLDNQLVGSQQPACAKQHVSLADTATRQQGCVRRDAGLKNLRIPSLQCSFRTSLSSGRHGWPCITARSGDRAQIEAVN